MKRHLTILASLIFCLAASAPQASAQPKKSRVANNNRRLAQQQGQTASRAAIMFPTAVDVPQEVTWRRDIYRSLDLAKDENAPLYYPEKPQGGSRNLFALLFELFRTGKLPVYEYNQNAVEDFSPAKRMHFKAYLDKYGIPYQIDGNSIQVDDIDVPSDEVRSYFVKESSYFDQNTATYHTRIVAFCPVTSRSIDDFSLDTRPEPLFWVKMEDAEPYLSQHMVMVSNVNNAARMSLADYFATNKYKGKIYMTTNMQGKALSQMFPTDSLLAKEQKRIEKEMTDFERHIWTEPVDSAEIARRDSAAAAEAGKGRRSRVARTSRTSSGSSARSARASRSSSSSSAKVKAEKAPKSSGGSSSPRVSVRRQRH